MKQKLLENKDEFYKLLDRWQKSSNQLPAFGIGLLKRVETCTKVYLLFEDMAFSNNRQEPYSYMNPIIKNEIDDINLLLNLFKNNSHLTRRKSDHTKNMDFSNKNLFQSLWNKYNEDEYGHSVKLMINRFKNNGLSVKDKNCLDIGCGGGDYA